jgi:hypothetical protein
LRRKGSTFLSKVQPAKHFARNARLKVVQFTADTTVTQLGILTRIEFQRHVGQALFANFPPLADEVAHPTFAAGVTRFLEEQVNLVGCVALFRGD